MQISIEIFDRGGPRTIVISNTEKNKYEPPQGWIPRIITSNESGVHIKPKEEEINQNKRKPVTEVY